MFDRVELSHVMVRNDTTLNIVLPEVEKVNLSGRVVTSFGEGLQGIELALVNRVTGTRVYTANNETDASGFYNSCQSPSGVSKLNFPLLGVAVMWGERLSK